MNKISIVATIKNIRFYSEDNCFAILNVEEENNPLNSFVAKGVISKPETEATFIFKGEWENNSRWGVQFKFDSAIPRSPRTVKGIETYLAKGNIYGIGPKLAKNIIKHFGEEIVKIIENQDIERLAEAPGIGKKKMQSILKAWNKDKELRETIMRLQMYGINGAIAQKLYKKYKENAINKVLENPYQLTKEVYGIGFKKADEIAECIQIQTNNPFRISAGIRHIIENEAIQKGNVYILEDKLTHEVFMLLKKPQEIVSEQEITNQINIMLKNNELTKEENKIFLTLYYKLERNIARKISEILYNQPKEKTIKYNIEKIQKKFNIQYDDTQKKAIQTAVEKNMMILTGGPGSGKTTVVKGIIEALKQKNQEIQLAAPTGKAAKRMKETTGMKATTIHRMLEINPTTHSFVRNEDNPIESNIIIIDESSMIDISLFHALIKAVPKNAKLILVGDVDQLPSVGPGKILKDLIDSQTIPVIRLTTIHRQAQSSHIITNAYKINNRQMPELSLPKEADFTFIELSDGNQIQELITRIVKFYNQKNIDVQVLSPMKQRGINSTNELNIRIQQEINPNGLELKIGQNIFRVNDKVIQTKNNYSKMVFNGDIGYIQDINTKKRKLYIKFEDKPETVEYESNQTSQLSLAYACTIHKSQGSEFPVVVIPYTKSFYIMLQKNLLYTGITRAKKKLFLIGEKDAIRISINATNNQIRKTTLKEKLQDYYNNYEEYESEEYYYDDIEEPQNIEE